MSDIRINLPQDRTVLILKRIQNKISGYKGYKEGGDARVSTQALYDDIAKRIDITLSNFKAAIDNLDMLEKFDEKKVAEGVYVETQDLTNVRIEIPTDPVPVSKESVESYYFSDEVGFKNSIDLLDNVNSFRSASISGVCDTDVLDKIKTNIESVGKFLAERNETLKGKN